jgi:hypothetical protein
LTIGHWPLTIATRMPESQQSPLDFDARCVRCGYRLRGLAGDPVRCPECFFENPSAELIRRHSDAARLNRLRGAGDAFLLALIALAAGPWLWWRSGPLPAALPVLGVGGLLAYQALAVCRRIMPEDDADGDGWRPLFLRYVAWTCTLALVPLGIWGLFSVLVWRVTTSFSEIRAGAGVDAVDVAVALAPTALVLFFGRPVRRLRWKQRRAFVRLVRRMKIRRRGAIVRTESAR